MKLFIYGSSHFIEQELFKSTSKDEDADIEVYFGDELNKEDFFSYINSASIFGNAKQAIIRKSESIKELDKFITSTKSCIETDIVFTALSEPSKAALKVLKDLNYIIIAEVKQSLASGIAGVKDIFAKFNLHISPVLAQQIFDMSNGDMQSINHDADKISLYLATNPDVKIENLLINLNDDKEEVVYKLIDLYSERKISEALSIMRSLTLKDNDFKIFYGLSKRIINIYLAYINPILIMENFDFVKSKVQGYKRHWKKDELAILIGLFAKLDLDIKTGRRTFEDAISEVMLR